MLLSPLVSNLFLSDLLLVGFTLLWEFFHKVALLVLPSLSLGYSLLVESSLLIRVHHSFKSVKLNFHLSTLNSGFNDFILLELRKAVSFGCLDAFQNIGWIDRWSWSVWSTGGHGCWKDTASLAHTTRGSWPDLRFQHWFLIGSNWFSVVKWIVSGG